MSATITQTALAHGRPHLNKIANSKHVRLDELTLLNSASWTVNPTPSPNIDGINPESRREVHISNCHIDVGRRAARPEENIAITNCTMRKGHGGGCHRQ